LQLAGQPSRVGGILARVAGWLVLAVGLTVAAVLGLGAQALFPGGIAGLVVGLPLGALSLAIGISLLVGGAKLDKRGASAERDARSKAVFALAAHKGGTLTAADVARGLDVPLEGAEAILSSFQRELPERVTVDLDGAGALVYHFDVPSPGGRVRVDPEVARSPNREEWERLEAEEAARTSARARAPR